MRRRPSPGDILSIIFSSRNNIFARLAGLLREKKVESRSKGSAHGGEGSCQIEIVRFYEQNYGHFARLQRGGLHRERGAAG